MKTALYLVPLLVLTVILLVRAEFQGKRRQIYGLKPLSTILVVGIALLSMLEPVWNRTYTLGVLLGLLFSLGGDIALMFMENRKAFMIGLVSFLVGQIVYAVVFTRLGSPGASYWLVAIFLLAAGLYFFRQVQPNLGPLEAPVLVYILVISFMVLQATTLGRPLFAQMQARLVVTGAVLFYISDLILAVNRFWKPWKYHRISLVLYYSGQALIALMASFFV